jgi:hypothetical protein
LPSSKEREARRIELRRRRRMWTTSKGVTNRKATRRTAPRKASLFTIHGGLNYSVLPQVVVSWHWRWGKLAWFPHDPIMVKIDILAIF